MNTESLNHHLATKVMGYVQPKEYQLCNWWHLNTGPVVKQNDWNPTENIEQAMMCLDTFIRWDLIRTAMGYHLTIYINGIPHDAGDPHEPNIKPAPAEAVSLACAKATGWEE